MKKKPVVDDDPLDREIDFTNARPNPFWLGVVDRRCVRLLDKDLAELFPDNESVNAALRGLAEIAQRSAEPQRISARTARARKSAK